MFLNCKERSVNDLYKLMTGCVVPRPIAWVSTTGAGGVNNLAPFSFFNAFGADPPMIGFAPGFKSITKSGDELIRVPKDTMRNIVETKEFVVNFVSRNLAEQMNQTSGDYPPDVSEFEKSAVTTAPSSLVKPPRVAESLVSFECKLIQLIQHGNNNLVLGEVIGMHLVDNVVTDQFNIDPEVLQAVGRLAGSWYTTTTDGVFEMVRPKV